MKLLLSCICSCLFSAGYAQSVYQFLYVEGDIHTKNQPLKVAQYYAEDTKVKLAGKLAIFYDTVKKELGTILNNDRSDAIANLRIPVRVQGFKCCVSGFTSFIAHNKRPYPVFYPDTELALSPSDEMKLMPSLQLTYKYWDTREKKFRMRSAPMNHSYRKVRLYEIIDYLQSIDGDKDLLEPFFFYAYDKNKSASDATTLIGERSLHIIRTNLLKTQITPFVAILQKRFPDPDKEAKEMMLSLLSDFVHELSGYPDEHYFKRWLKEHCGLDISW